MKKNKTLQAAISNDTNLTLKDFQGTFFKVLNSMIASQMEILNINFEKKHPNSNNHTTSSTSKLIPEQHISRHNSIEEKPTTEIKQYTNEIQTTTTNDNNS